MAGKGASFTLTQPVADGLLYIQRYRFLTTAQFARITLLKPPTAAGHLRSLETAGFLGFFGNAGLPGFGKSPKVYFLTRRGFAFLKREAGISEDEIGTYKEIKVDARWSPVMFPRLRTVDLLLSMECAVRQRPALSLVKTFLEYRRVKRGSYVVRETTDYVGLPEVGANRIIPDGAFVLANMATGKRALFFLEMDMGTARIVSHLHADTRVTLYSKLHQYDRYLQSLHYRKTYAEFGDFGFFTLLFVTIGSQRLTNIRQNLGRLPGEFAQYYRFSLFDRATGDFLGAIWYSRLASDTLLYSLVREGG